MISAGQASKFQWEGLGAVLVRTSAVGEQAFHKTFWMFLPSHGFRFTMGPIMWAALHC